MRMFVFMESKDIWLEFLCISAKNVIISYLFLSPREQTNKRRVKEIVKEFSLLCRGLQGSGYSDY